MSKPANMTKRPGCAPAYRALSSLSFGPVAPVRMKEVFTPTRSISATHAATASAVSAYAWLWASITGWRKRSTRVSGTTNVDRSVPGLNRSFRGWSCGPATP